MEDDSENPKCIIPMFVRIKESQQHPDFASSTQSTRPPTLDTPEQTSHIMSATSATSNISMMSAAATSTSGSTSPLKVKLEKVVFNLFQYINILILKLKLRR